MLGLDERWSGGIDALVAEANRLLAQLLPEDRAARLKDEVNPRLVRHYTTVGLLPAPTREGREARYGRVHLLGLLALRRLMADGLSGKALAGALTGRSEQDLADLARMGVTGEEPLVPPAPMPASLAAGPGPLLMGNMRVSAPQRSPALAYLDGLRRTGKAEVAAAAPAPGPVRQARRPQDPAPAGEVWRRVTLEPGLEVQVSSEFRVPRGEARWDDLLRRLREVLEDAPRR
ncbi:MerR family transcriptional regulator [Deinococcus radiotolerans]|uniref:HTH merR-type domain-containing protein n=1 Tax=Deinococcus radiotolerans TaxID=1309407 RepID=A0ABQ2FR99_9DEIO|nr:MerR family transcriptional regulator [Deinococcus radiotolerans]GGL18819.1 hypothetical protein GCM10010844_42160 [Deinococcus radiotolerans]